MKDVLQHSAKLVSEAQHQQEVNGGVEYDQAVADRREYIQPARTVSAGSRHRRVDGVQDKAKQRDGAADGEHEHYDDRKSSRSQLAFL